MPLKPDPIGRWSRCMPHFWALRGNGLCTVPSATRPDHVPGAADRVKKRRVKSLVDLCPQARNMDVDDVGLRIEMILPNALEEHRSCHNLPRVPQEIFVQAEFAGLQFDRR